MIVYNRIIPFGGFEAMAIWPFIFSKMSLVSSRRKNHETIHLRQQFEVMLLSAIVLFVLCLLLISWWWMTAAPFVYYVLYVIEYAVRSIIYGNREEGYLNISFEQEAITYERDYYYLGRRKHFAWLRFITKKTSANTNKTI